jgi:hypothetical protein
MKKKLCSEQAQDQADHTQREIRDGFTEQDLVWPDGRYKQSLHRPAFPLSRHYQ